MIIKLYSGYKITRDRLKKRKSKRLSFDKIKSMMEKNDDPDSEMLTDNDLDPAVKFLYYVYLMQMDEAEQEGAADGQV